MNDAGHSATEPAPFGASGWTCALKLDGWRWLALIVAGEVQHSGGT